MIAVIRQKFNHWSDVIGKILFKLKENFREIDKYDPFD